MSEEYKYRYELTIKANDPKGFMDAVWKCWEAFQKDHVPMGSSCPRSMGPEHSAKGELFDNITGEKTYFKKDHQ